MTHYAIMHKSGKVVATGETFGECADEVDELKIWDMAPGSVAPYYITTIAPAECSICNGSGTIEDFGDKFTCRACEGTKFSYDQSKDGKQ